MIRSLRAVWGQLRAFWGADAPEHMDAGAGPHVEPSPPAGDVGPEWSLRLPRALLAEMWTDLHRPHAFAHERVGFLLAQEVAGHGGKILLARRYEPVREDEYIHDRRVGARINRDAIRRMLRYALDGENVFHVHCHAHPGRPEFSRVDEENLRELIPSFCGAAPQFIHGALLLSDDHGIAWGWKAGSEAVFSVSSITVIGYPLLRWEVLS